MKAAVAKAAAAAKQSAAVGSEAAEAAKAAAAEKAALEAVRVCSLPFVSASAGCVVAVGGCPVWMRTERSYRVLPTHESSALECFTSLLDCFMT